MRDRSTEEYCWCSLNGENCSAQLSENGDGTFEGLMSAGGESRAEGGKSPTDERESIDTDKHARTAT